MHFCCLVFTDEFPTNKVIEDKLKPFNEEDFFDSKSDEYPMILWDWWQVGGRYGGKIKLSINNDERYNWKFYADIPRNNRLYRSILIDKLSKKDESWFREEDYYSYMGWYDGYIYVDACMVEDIINADEIRGFCCIDVDSTAYTREYWDGKIFKAIEDYDDTVAKLFEKNKNKYLCIVDLHD